LQNAAPAHDDPPPDPSAPLAHPVLEGDDMDHTEDRHEELNRDDELATLPPAHDDPPPREPRRVDGDLVDA
jgi:hypothetical protein